MRRHQVIWQCDRCGKEAIVKAKSDTHLPVGWEQVTLRGVPFDLCNIDASEWGRRFDRAVTDFLPLPVETHTVADDDLEELDPETNPTWDNPHPDGPS